MQRNAWIISATDSVTKGEIIQNVSAEADEAYNKNWTEFKAACGQ